MIKPLVAAVAAGLILYVGVWKWMICRVYVGPGQVLVITSKFGEENKDPDNQRVVPEGTQGILKEVRGEGRHFYDPIAYTTDTRSEVIEIEPEQIAFVESMSGTPLTGAEFLAEEGQKGPMRRPLTPGKWRLNPFAAKATVVQATVIAPGFVGCVTRLSGGAPPEGRLADETQRGIQRKVLQPGVYYLNPREFKVDSVWVGYKEITLEDVTFPSKDGFTIKLDISVVWGLHPKDVPVIMSRIGNPEAVVQKIIRPQVESICRIEGSKYGAKEFIEGTSREQFQNAFTQQLFEEAKARNIELFIGLVRDIEVPLELREPIQKSKIAAEEQLTKEEQRKTQVVQNELEELKAQVEKGVREVGAETEKMVAEVRATGERKVATIGAEKEVAVADVARKVAEAKAEQTRILGKADAEVTELLQKAEADKFQKNVAALGNPEAYANYIFATKLPDELRIYLRYAGPGTFWTDLPAGAKSLEDAAMRKILEREQREQSPPKR
jgi:regulator of protease activity HflC (stomatin/prohibitin superfamily)